MRRRARAGIVAIALTLTALSSCGASGGPTTAEPGPQDTATERPAPAAASKGGVALKRIGSFDTPVYVTGAPGAPELLFVVEQGGQIEVLRKGRRLGRPFLDISGLVSFEGEQGLLSVAFPPDYAEQRPLLRLLHGPAGRHPDRRIPPRRSQREPPAGSRRAVIEIPHPENSNHNGGQAAVPRQPPLLRHRRRRLRRRPAEQRPEQGRPARQAAADRPARRRTGGPTRYPSSNPFVGRAGRDEIYSYGLRNPFRFSFDTVTAGRRGSRSATSARTSFEEIDYTTVGGRGGRQLRLGRLRGLRPLRAKTAARPRTPAAP